MRISSGSGDLLVPSVRSFRLLTAQPDLFATTAFDFSTGLGRVTTIIAPASRPPGGDSSNGIRLRLTSAILQYAPKTSFQSSYMSLTSASDGSTLARETTRAVSARAFPAGACAKARSFESEWAAKSDPGLRVAIQLRPSGSSCAAWNTRLSSCIGSGPPPGVSLKTTLDFDISRFSRGGLADRLPTGRTGSEQVPEKPPARQVPGVCTPLWGNPAQAVK